jgi:hypothetical protein
MLPDLPGVAVRTNDSICESLWCFLREIASNASLNDLVWILSFEFTGITGRVGMLRTMRPNPWLLMEVMGYKYP